MRDGPRPRVGATPTRARARRRRRMTRRRVFAGVESFRRDHRRCRGADVPSSTRSHANVSALRRCHAKISASRGARTGTKSPRFEPRRRRSRGRAVTRRRGGRRRTARARWVHRAGRRTAVAQRTGCAIVRVSAAGEEGRPRGETHSSRPTHHVGNTTVDETTDEDRRARRCSGRRPPTRAQTRASARNSTSARHPELTRLDRGRGCRAHGGILQVNRGDEDVRGRRGDTEAAVTEAMSTPRDSRV